MILRRYHAILLGVAILLSGAVSYSSWDPRPYQLSQLSSPALREIPKRPWIALTFDDGPHPVMTERLLDTLRQEGAPSTFFIVGKMAVRYPEIVQEIHRQGHEVANHSFSHPNFARADSKTVLNELAQTRAVIQKLTGQDTLLFRPPGGDYSRASLKATSQAGYHMILWNVLTKDVNGASASVMKRHILNQASDGAIILMHSGIPNTIQMLPDVIRTLRQEGYHFVTISQLMSHERPPAIIQPPLTDTAAYPIVSR